MNDRAAQVIVALGAFFAFVATVIWAPSQVAIALPLLIGLAGSTIASMAAIQQGKVASAKVDNLQDKVDTVSTNVETVSTNVESGVPTRVETARKRAQYEGYMMGFEAGKTHRGDKPTPTDRGGNPPHGGGGGHGGGAGDKDGNGMSAMNYVALQHYSSSNGRRW